MTQSRQHGAPPRMQTPPGAVASTISLVINAKKIIIATSLTANEIAKVKE